MALTNLMEFKKEVASETLEIVQDNVELIKYVILKQLSTNPRHVLKRKKNKLLLHRFGVAIDQASKITGTPWEEIVMTSFCESTFRGVKTKGDAGEVGLMQLHRKAPWTHCEEQLNRPVDRHSIEDQYICGGFWLKKRKEECDGSIKQGSAKYMTGSTCKPEQGGRLWHAIRHRMGILKEVRKYINTFKKEKQK